ncbi:MAG: DedA family protein [Oligoflexia bacterium]|nr:DedA family protein [Oligoflexia bacterium]
MIHELLEKVGAWIIMVEQSLGYPGIILLMAIESACIPLPSEIIMPFAGYLVYKGVFGLWEVAIAGAVGCVLGGWVAYWVGKYGGRPFVDKYGKYILLNPKDVQMAEDLFNKYGEIIAFVSRLLPVVRTFIALPAGMAKMNFLKFSIYSFLGSLPFCYFLAWVGMKMGENWRDLKVYFHQADIFIGVLILIGAIFWIRHHILFLKRS